MGRYKYYCNGNQIICVSHYAGKSVRGIAKCAPEDTFDKEFGMKLARLRCDRKVAEQRYNRAMNLYGVAAQELTKAQNLYLKRREYFRDAHKAREEACDALADFYSDAEIKR